MKNYRDRRGGGREDRKSPLTEKEKSENPRRVRVAAKRADEKYRVANYKPWETLDSLKENR